MIPNIRAFNFDLGETADMIRETVRDFAQDEIAPRAAEIDRTNQFPRDLWPQMGELGLHGITVEEEYGGAGLGYLEHVVAMEEMSPRLGLGRALLRRAFQSLRQPDPPQRHRGAEAALPAEADLRRACRRARHVGARRGLGRRLDEHPGREEGRPLRPQRHQDVDHQRSRSPTRWSSTPRPIRRPAPRGITAFLIEKGFKGFSTHQKLDKLGMRGSDTCELVFEDCEVPEENVLGEVGRGVNVLMSGLDYERAVLAAGPLGIMQACMDVVMPYVHERKQFGQPIGEFQLVQGKLADMYVTMNAAKAYVYAVAKACDRGETTREDAAGAILYAAEKATQCALDAIQLLGGNGYINDYPTGRLLRDAKLYEIGAGTSEIRRMLIGRELFEKSA